MGAFVKYIYFCFILVSVIYEMFSPKTNLDIKCRLRGGIIKKTGFFSREFMTSMKIRNHTYFRYSIGKILKLKLERCD